MEFRKIFKCTDCGEKICYITEESKNKLTQTLDFPTECPFEFNNAYWKLVREETLKQKEEK